MDCTIGRREANKARTRAQLVDAVYTILETQGPQAVTAERIADAAGVSRRTFFNYFPSVEALIASGAKDILDRVRSSLAARPAEESLLDAALAVIEETFTLDLLAEAVRAWRAVERSPAAGRFVLAAHSTQVTELAHEWSRGRLDPQARDPLTSQVLTAILLVAFDAGRRHWLAGHEGPVDAAARAAFLAEVGRAIDVIRPAYPGHP